VGSVRQVIDAAGQVSLAQSFDPFGILISQSTNLPIYQFPSLPIFWLHTPAGHRPASGGMLGRSCTTCGHYDLGGYGCPGSH
jgi:hypothetical protein